jgi:type III secretion protein R
MLDLAQNFPNPVDLLFVLVGLALIPFVVVMVTCYTKLIVILMLLRNAMGLQNVPPTFALNGITLLLSLFIMAPVLQTSYAYLKTWNPARDGRDIIAQFEPAFAPFSEFMLAHSSEKDRAFYTSAAAEIWKGKEVPKVTEQNPFILIPAFVTGELTRAFEAGFLLFLPFLVIDLVVAASLSAMGMQMVQPTAIGLPLKVLLFVQVDGWRLILNSLILSYR